MNLTLVTILAIAMAAQIPVIGDNDANDAKQSQLPKVKTPVPYEFIVSRSNDDFTPALSGATFAMATLSNDRLDLELIFRVGQRLSYSRLTDDAALDFHPVWMPDGQSILFDSNRNRRIAIWRLVLSESKPTMMIASEEEEMCFGASPSPDGKRIAYTRASIVDFAWWTNYVIPTTSGIRPEQFQIVIRDTETSKDKILTYGMLPAWSPDGMKIAYSLFDGESWNLWTIDIKSGDRHQLSKGDLNDFAPAWSPDQHWLAFCRANHEKKTSDIWTVESNGKSLTQLTDTPKKNEGGPCWTADGIYIHTDTGEGSPYDIALIPKVMLPIAVSTASITSEKKYAIPSKAHLKIQVLNSTKISGLARRTTELLRKNGFDVIDVGNTENERNLNKGKIYYKPGMKTVAKEIAELIPGTQVLQQASKFRCDIVIVLGRNTKY